MKHAGLAWPARFKAKVNRRGPLVDPRLGRCWIWTGALRGGSGYGRFRWGGREDYVHRWAHGAIGPGLEPDHLSASSLACARRTWRRSPIA
jgi:hypothetical protein